MERSNSPQQQQPTKRPYLKPEVTRFPLRPEEAVLGFCKSTSSAGPSGGTCRVIGFCQTAGS